MAGAPPSGTSPDDELELLRDVTDDDRDDAGGRLDELLLLVDDEGGGLEELLVVVDDDGGVLLEREVELLLDVLELELLEELVEELLDELLEDVLRVLEDDEGRREDFDFDTDEDFVRDADDGVVLVPVDGESPDPVRMIASTTPAMTTTSARMPAVINSPLRRGPSSGGRTMASPTGRGPTGGMGGPP